MILIRVLLLLSLYLYSLKASAIYEYSPKQQNEQIFQSYLDKLNNNSKNTKSISNDLDINQFKVFAKEIGFQNNDDNIQSLFIKMDKNKVIINDNNHKFKKSNIIIK